MPPRDAVFAHKTRDVALKVVSKCGLYRICAVNTTNILQQTIEKHGLHGWDSPALDLMGTTISLTNLLASLLQGEERVECKFHAAFGASMTCESLALGECRAFLGTAQQGAMQNVLSVRRVLYHNSDPVVSATLADFDDLLPEEKHRRTFQVMGSTASSSSSNGMPANPDRFLNSAVRHAQQRFNLNLTPHAYHYFKQSEGIPTAVLVTTLVEDDYSHLATKKQDANGKGAAEAEAASDPEFVRKKVVYSTGVLVQPLALDMKKENSTPAMIEKLQDLFNSIALCPAPPTVASVAHTALGVRATEEGTLLQDVLSLVSGDFKGSYETVKAARLMADADIETVKLQYQPIRERYGLKELLQKAASSSEEGAVNNGVASSTSAAGTSAAEVAESGSTNKPVELSEAVANLNALSLDSESITRTALDFFCRCSADSITKSFTAMPIEDRKDLIGKTAGCVYCSKEYVLEAKHLGIDDAEPKQDQQGKGVGEESKSQSAPATQA